MMDIYVEQDPKHSDALTCEGYTEAGIEFVDAYVPEQGTGYTVVDAGKITIHRENLDNFIAKTKLASLLVEVEA